ncbi:Succinate dehydrogenase iron-sulfur protein [uncultured Synechococcales cyanobacterium]|uniref:Fumarate reductase iron-sulfur subunit n=1 Tax=uncultured Synechococcales cyanobacterium TaxID=1936017 RepID=A0A6J4VNK4_9CYAN|nr:Succinate dehydrogenase iron-sulfur protein [uncultured Synechococcales cyanobacterium]
MQVLFKVIRQNSNKSPWVQTYTIDVNPSSTILDCLNRIKWEQDGSLAFRKNCRNTICGSCSMRINGRSALACKENVAQELARLAAITEQRAEQTPGNFPAVEVPQPEPQSLPLPEITVAPMGNMPVLKDLVVDMAKFWGNLQAVEPYISTAARAIPEREFLQTPVERAKLDQTGNCILCGACYSECNAVEVSSEFVGPHALAKAYRTVVDSRDDATESRLEKSNQGIAGVWGCTRCFNCNTVCPMEVAPLDQINRMKGEILERQTETASRSVRHRKVMIDLVKQGGWIDERRFGLRVVGNNFRDLRGVLSLIPLGLRMLQRGKFPETFEPSPGTQEVRSLIESVQLLESASPSSMTETVSKSPTSFKAEPYDQLQPKFGWTPYAELTNGRFAMIGFVALLIQELLTRQDFFTWLGLW